MTDCVSQKKIRSTQERVRSACFTHGYGVPSISIIGEKKTFFRSNTLAHVLKNPHDTKKEITLHLNLILDLELPPASKNGKGRFQCIKELWHDFNFKQRIRGHFSKARLTLFILVFTPPINFYYYSPIPHENNYACLVICVKLGHRILHTHLICLSLFWIF